MGITLAEYKIRPTPKYDTPPPPNVKLTKQSEISQTMKKILKLANNLLDKDRLKLVEELGVGQEGNGKYFTCHVCGRVLKKEDFYPSTEPISQTHISPTCRECATTIAAPPNSEGKPTPTRSSVIAALSLLRKPFLQNLWDSSVLESASKKTNKRGNLWTSYIRRVSNPAFATYNFESSDFHGDGNELSDAPIGKKASVDKSSEMYTMFKQNKADVIRLLGYEPFAQEKLSDQPFLYSQLLGLLDSSEDSNDDLMRVAGAVSIVRGFLQQSVIDDKIARLLQDPRNVDKNAPVLKSYLEMKKNLTTTISTLAEDNCISLKHNKNAKKGENTWTGKLKKIKDMNLRAGEVNGFDIETCKAMRQVMDMSHASIIQQLQLDESEWSDMVAEQRTKIVNLERDLETAQEINRILLRENLDLRDTLDDAGLLAAEDLINLNDLFSPYSGVDSSDTSDTDDTPEIEIDAEDIIEYDETVEEDSPEEYSPEEDYDDFDEDDAGEDYEDEENVEDDEEFEDDEDDDSEDEEEYDEDDDFLEDEGDTDEDD